MLIGVDGASGGWISAQADEDRWASPTLKLYETFSDLLADAPPNAIVAVDIPIGLPEKTLPKGRACEVEARNELDGSRKSSVFSTASRRVIYARDKPEAISFIRADLPKRKGLSAQAWAIVPKIKQVDQALAALPSVTVRETHPEVIFARLSGRRGLAAGKKTPDGQALRIALLEHAGLPATALLMQRPSRCGRDDLVDALACLWTARRIALGKAQVLGEADAYFGQRTGIWA